MKIPFFKMHGSGNDFVVIDHRTQFLDDDNLRLGEISKFICNRQLSVGAHGVLLVEPSDKADFKMRLFQPDGSEAEMCGNGARCIAKFVFLNEIIENWQMTFETMSGILDAEIMDDTVKVKLTLPKDLKKNITLQINGQKITGDYIDTGVPHFVIFSKDNSQEDVYNTGKIIRFHKEFAPRGTNVNFYTILDSHTISNRTYERGVENETLACGTGSTAAAIISGLHGLTHSPVNVRTKSGLILKVFFDIAGDEIKNVYLQGDAEVSFTGVLNLKD